MIGRSIVLTGVLFVSFYTYYHLEWNVIKQTPVTSTSDFFKKVPVFQRSSIDIFFRTQFVNDNLGLILTGDKPMGLYYITPTTADISKNWDSLFSPDNLLRFKGWYLWNHYQPSRGYNVVFERSNRLDCIEVYAINKSRIKEYLAFYNKKTNQNNEISLSIHDLKSNLDNNEALLGFLLGFGYRNSELFQNLSCTLERQEFIKSPLLAHAWDHHKELLRQINKKRLSHNLLTIINSAHYWDLSTAFLPGFRSNPEYLETGRLTTHYLEARKKMLRVFSNKSFLKTTLELIFTEPSYTSLIDTVESPKETTAL